MTGKRVVQSLEKDKRKEVDDGRIKDYCLLHK